MYIKVEDQYSLREDRPVHRPVTTINCNPVMTTPVLLQACNNKVLSPADDSAGSLPFSN